MSSICIIPARGGSTRIPKKNIKHFFGKPIIEYSIDAAKRADVFDRIIVSTDDADIAEVALAAGAELHNRPDYLAVNEVGTQEVIQEALKDMIRWKDFEAQYVCCLYATNPMIDPIELSQAHAHLRFNSNLNYVVPVAKWLQDPGRWYFGRTQAFLVGISLLSATTRILPVDANRSIDINTEDDWKQAEKMYQDLLEAV